MNIKIDLITDETTGYVALPIDQWNQILLILNQVCTWQCQPNINNKDIAKQQGGLLNANKNSI